MNLQQVNPGDIVLIDDGKPFYGLVSQKEKQMLFVRPLYGASAERRAKARDVVEHWKYKKGKVPNGKN